MTVIERVRLDETTALYEATIKWLQLQREQLEGQLAVQKRIAEQQEALAEAAKSQADEALAALRSVMDILDREGISIDDLHIIAARARAALDPTSVLESFPRQLKVVFAGLEPEHPDVAEISLSRLRPGSVELLHTYGVCAFGDRDENGVMRVTLSDRTWAVADAARQWFEAEEV